MVAIGINSLSPNVYTGDTVGFHFRFDLWGGDEGEVGTGEGEGKFQPSEPFDSRDEAEVMLGIDGQVGVVA